MSDDTKFFQKISYHGPMNNQVWGVLPVAEATRPLRNFLATHRDRAAGIPPRLRLQGTLEAVVKPRPFS